MSDSALFNELKVGSLKMSEAKLRYLFLLLTLFKFQILLTRTSYRAQILSF